MKTLQKLQEERNQKYTEAQNLIKTAKSEERELSTEEFAQFEALEGEIDGLDQEIEKKSKVEAFAKRKIAGGFQTGESFNPVNTPQEVKDLRNFSVLKMIRSQIDKKPLDGIEAEVDQEGRKEARALNQEILGVAIPSRIISARDNSVTMPTQPEDGSAVVEKDVRADLSMMDMLRNALVCRQLGATFINDLVGNVSFTSLTQRPAATWKAEVAELDKSNVKFASEDLAPKRLGTYTLQSLQFLRQTAPSIERKIREEIVYALQEGVDIAAINGTGASNQPTGILNDTDVAAINVAALGANGAALTRGNLIALRTALLKRNIRGQKLGWLINAAVEGKLSDTPIATGSDQFILDGERLLGYPYVMSNMVPSNITKGTGTNLSAAIFGDWSELYIAQWGGIDLLVDPYTLSTAGQVKIVAQGFFNVLVHRPEAFVYYKDIVTV